MKKKTSTLLITGVIIVLLVEVLFASSVNANFTPLPELPTPLYIKEDGTVEGGAGALQQTGNVYTFVRDINKTIEIQKDDVILDGNGFTLTKPPEVNTAALMTPIGWFPSIRISNRDNVTIMNINFDRCYTAIRVENSSNIVIVQNNIHNGNGGISMSSSVKCIIIGNEVVDHSFTGLNIMGSSFLNIAYNNVSRNHFHGGWIAVSHSNISRNSVTDNSFDNFGIGLYLYGVNCHNIIFENNFVNNEIGLFYQGAHGTSVNNTVYRNYWSNYQDAIVNVAADSASGVDKSPLTSPISTSFDPSLFPLPSTHIPEFPSWAVMAITVAALAVTLAVYKRRLCNPNQRREII
jgi:parallel beta-helix repeat protein